MMRVAVQCVAELTVNHALMVNADKQSYDVSDTSDVSKRKQARRKQKLGKQQYTHG